MDFARVLGVLDREVFGGLVGCRGDNKLDEVFKAGHKAYLKLDGIATKIGIAFGSYPFTVVSGASTVVEKDSASSRSTPVALAPQNHSVQRRCGHHGPGCGDQAGCDGVVAVAELHEDC